MRFPGGGGGAGRWNWNWWQWWQAGRQAGSRFVQEKRIYGREGREDIDVAMEEKVEIGNWAGLRLRVRLRVSVRGEGKNKDVVEVEVVGEVRPLSAVA